MRHVTDCHETFAAVALWDGLQQHGGRDAQGYLYGGGCIALCGVGAADVGEKSGWEGRGHEGPEESRGRCTGEIAGEQGPARGCCRVRERVDMTYSSCIP